MRGTQYGFEIMEKCASCAWKTEGFFCDFGPETLDVFDHISFTSIYPAGAILYTEGEPARGVYVLCHGRAKMSVAATDGRTLITRVAEPGEILGLSHSITGKKHRCSVETLEPSQLKFVRRDDLVRFLTEHNDACYHAVEKLSQESEQCDEHMRALGLSHSAAEKLAHLILTWCDEAGKEADDGVRIKMLVTHLEIAQLIGTSRETVTRLLGQFRERGILSIRGSTLVVHNKAALEARVLI